MDRPLTCKEFIEFLDDYLSGTQAREARAEFERHLKLCPPCVDYLKSYQATVRLASSLCGEGDGGKVPAAVPEDLVQAILAARKKL